MISRDHEDLRVAGAPAFAKASACLGLCLVLALFAVACGETAESAGDASTDPVSLEPTFDSPEELAKAILLGLETEDGAALESYALTKDQFRLYVWPKLPSSRPERGVPFEFGWGDLYQKSHNSLLRTFARYKDRKLELVELRFEDGLTDYGTYVVHRDARVKVRTEEGEEEWLDLFGSVIEWQGRYKLFSYVAD